MATRQECEQFISKIVPTFTKSASKHGFKIVSFAIAQACYEGAWGQSFDAINKHNILGIGPHRYYKSWDDCIEGYYTDTILGKSSAAKNAKTLDQYYQAFVSSGYLGDGTEAHYYSQIKSIISTHNLTKYDNGKVVAGGSEDNGGTRKLEEFMQKCLSYKGTSESAWAAKHPKWYDPGQWCSDFVSACGEETGCLGKVFDGSASAYVCAHSVKKYGGQIHNEKSYTPQRGDLINFTWDGRGPGPIDAAQFCDHIGVVTKCEKGVVHTIEGNNSASVRECSYQRSSSVLACFCTPNWSKFGGMGEGGSGGSGGLTGTLFDTTNTREDAIVREVAYLKTEYDKKNKRKIDKYTPIISKQPIKLSMANYTDLMKTYWDIGAPNAGGEGAGEESEGGYDYSKLDSKVREVVMYLVKKGLNNAAACGIAGNIKHESSFDPGAIGDYGTSFGLCQWHLDRGDKMKQMAGANWATNVTGQLDYLWYEMENSYKSMLTELKGIENSESGCKKAADIFVRQFEAPAAVDAQSLIRQASAAEYFKKITKVVKKSTTSSSNADLASLSKDRRKRVERARAEMGKPYAWGAVGPDAYDCSGFVSYCLSGQHIRLGTTYTFLEWPRAKNPAPGDIAVDAGHTGLYIGDNKMIHAADYGIGVIEGPVQSGMVIVTYGG